MKESEVERYLDVRIRQLGGFTRKWTSPQRTGVPDRICFLPNLVFFVEVKTDKGKLTIRQQREIDLIRSLGLTALVCYGCSGVNQIYNWLSEEGYCAETK